MNVKNICFNGLVIELHPEVYRPAEDTFGIIEAIDVKKGDRVVEIGTGSGLIALECARRGASVLCTDLNPFAVEYVKINYKKNSSMIKGELEVRKGDLFSAIKKDEKFDVVILNPPYLPTKPKDRVGGSGWFDLAVDGGSDGLKITKKFVEQVKSYMNLGGKAYFVFSSLSCRSKLEMYLSNAKLDAEVVLSRLYDDEHIDVYRIDF